MFVDSVEITIQSGNGGAGAVSFRREKFVLQGGPDGGDGGSGGNVYFVSDRNTTTLAHFRGNKVYKARNGEDGKGSKCTGKKGDDVFIKVPPGTMVIDLDSKEILLDLIEDKKQVKILSGGKGGLGNVHFKNSKNQAPTYAQKGIAGVTKNVALELKLIADVALVGFPNAGKSSLISKMTNSRPKIAPYAFSTLIPNLGVIDIDYSNSIVLADIPGLIEGASIGKGLGISFLRHIERTKLILFLLDSSSDMQLEKQLEILQYELKNYSHSLGNRDYAIAITKMDLQNDLQNSSGGSENNAIMQQKIISHDVAKNIDLNKIIISKELDDFKNLGIKNSANASKNNILDSNHANNSSNSNTKNDKEPLCLFSTPISSVTDININELKYLLLDCIKFIN